MKIKKLAGIIMAVSLAACVMVFSMTSCKPIEGGEVVSMPATVSTVSKADKALDGTSSAPAPSSTPPPQTSLKQEGDNVIITLPKGLIAEGDTGELTIDQVHSGFVSALRNDDGSISYTLSKTSYDSYIEKLKNETTASLNEMVGSGNYTSVKEVIFNKELNEVTLVVNKNQYQSGTDRYATKGIGLQLATYQLFTGIQERDLRVVVNVETSETGEVIDTIVYPDALK